MDNANSRVDNMAKTLSDSQSTQASLNTSLQSQIDAQAAANIKNQTTLDNTIKSVASITSTHRRMQRHWRRWQRSTRPDIQCRGSQRFRSEHR
ncbi:hypothetical protein [Klebsiella pneumoniae]|uniref:hypothetical protein n=1 Tax=Klebsiella pneumoniae TaxID=573 RepID=UPI0039752051